MMRWCYVFPFCWGGDHRLYFQLSSCAVESNAAAVAEADIVPQDKVHEPSNSKPSKRQKKNLKKVRSQQAESGSSEEDSNTPDHEMNDDCKAVSDDMAKSVSCEGAACTSKVLFFVQNSFWTSKFVLCLQQMLSRPKIIFLETWT